MKVGIEVQRLFRKKKYGIETSSLELIKKLQQLDKKNQFVVFVKQDRDQECFQESENFKIRKVGGKMFADFEHIFLPIAAYDEKIDVLHCTGNTTPYFATVPIVQTLHDIIFLDPIPRNDSWYQRVGNQYRRKMVPLVSNRSKTIITVSKYEKDRIVSRLGIDEQKIEVIYNGINEQHFRVCKDKRVLDRVKTEYQLPDQYILFLGNQSGRKNPMGVIEAYLLYAAKVFKPLPLVAPGLSQKFIQQALRTLNGTYDPSLFITPGYIKDEDLPYLYTLSEVFLFPSLSEGFGMPVIEAMSCATPVITSKISCMPEIAGDAGIFVDPLSPPSIADGLLSLLSDPVLRCEKIQDGILNAKRFSWTNTAEKVLSVYERIVHPPTKVIKPASRNVILEPAMYLFNKFKL